MTRSTDKREPISSVEAWLELPELMLSGTEALDVYVLKAGVLIGKMGQLRAQGAPEPCPVGDEVHGLLATVTIQDERGERVLRLPRVVAGWAAECCAAAQRGRNPLPARIRFRTRGDGVEVSFIDRVPKTIASSGKLVAYIDESGNTGDVAIAKNLVGDQPTFALFAVAETDGTEALARTMADLRKRHGIRAQEIKSRAMDRYPDLVPELVEEVQRLGLPIFVEVMDKAYFVATRLVSHVLAGPWLPMGSRRGKSVANAMADVLSEHVSMKALVAYCEFASSPCEQAFRAFQGTFRAELSAARECATDEDVAQMLAMIRQVFDEDCDLSEEDIAAGRYVRLLPPPDQSRRGKSIAMLPHIPAFTYLFARLNRFASDASAVRVVHDEQVHFDALLQDYATLLESNAYAEELRQSVPADLAHWVFTAKKLKLEFADSRQCPGIQATDILARFCTRRLNAVITGTVGDDPVMSRLFDLQDAVRGLGINVVSTTARYKRFWGPAAAEGTVLL